MINPINIPETYDWDSIDLPCYYMMMLNDDFTFTSEYVKIEQKMKVHNAPITSLLSSKLFVPIDVDGMLVAKVASTITDSLTPRQVEILTGLYNTSLLNITSKQIMYSLMSGQVLPIYRKFVSFLDMIKNFQQHDYTYPKMPWFITKDDACHLYFLDSEQRYMYVNEKYGVCHADVYDTIKYLSFNDYTNYKFEQDDTDIVSASEQYLVNKYGIYLADIVNREKLLELVKFKKSMECFYISNLDLYYGHPGKLDSRDWYDLAIQLESPDSVNYSVDALNMLFYNSMYHPENYKMQKFRQSYVCYLLRISCSEKILANLATVGDFVFSHLSLLLDGQINKVEDKYYNSAELQTVFRLPVAPLYLPQGGYVFGQALNLYLSGADDSSFMHQLLELNLNAYISIKSQVLEGVISQKS